MVNLVRVSSVSELQKSKLYQSISVHFFNFSSIFSISIWLSVPFIRFLVFQTHQYLKGKAYCKFHNSNKQPQLRDILGCYLGLDRQQEA